MLKSRLSKLMRNSVNILIYSLFWSLDNMTSCQCAKWLMIQRLKEKGPESTQFVMTVCQPFSFQVQYAQFDMH